MVLSGCSGGGKSTLLAELGRRGFATVEEPGRRIVASALSGGAGVLPWEDMAGFARCAIEMAVADLARADAGVWTFFDRGVVDAASALQAASGERVLARLGAAHRYHPTVFLTPPWRALFAGDDERQHDFDAAVVEHERLERDYAALGYDLVELPRVDVGERVAFLLSRLRLPSLEA